MKTLSVKPRCKYCLSILDAEGYCSKPCRLGKLAKEKAEAEKRAEEERRKADENAGQEHPQEPAPETNEGGD